MDYCFRYFISLKITSNSHQDKDKHININTFETCHVFKDYASIPSSYKNRGVLCKWCILSSIVSWAGGTSEFLEIIGDIDIDCSQSPLACEMYIRLDDVNLIRRSSFMKMTYFAYCERHC